MNDKANKTIFTKMLYVAACAAFLFTAAVPAPVMAEETTETDDWTDNGITNTFYRPKAAFQTRFDYEEYCEQMYKNGYMDEDYNWTDEALDYINNPTKETSEALDKSAKTLVESRIAEGKMDAADNPFLTYDERMALLDENSGSSTGENTGGITEPATEDGTEAVSETMEDENTEYSETIAEEDTEEAESTAPTESEAESESETIETKGGFFKKAILAAIITVIVFVVYFLWQRYH